MAELTADKHYAHLGTPTIFAFSANGADTFYAGALLFADTAGGVQAVPAAGDHFVGIVTKQQIITAAGQLVEAYIDGYHHIPYTGAAAADEGEALYMDVTGTLSDNTADLVVGGTAAANDILIGRVFRVESGKAWTRLEPNKLFTATGWGG